MATPAPWEKPAITRCAGGGLPVGNSRLQAARRRRKSEATTTHNAPMPSAGEPEPVWQPSGLEDETSHLAQSYSTLPHGDLPPSHA